MRKYVTVANGPGRNVCTDAFADMIGTTDTDHAPWWATDSNDKKRARINGIAHLLQSILKEHAAFEKPKLGKRQDQPKHASATLPFRYNFPDATIGRTGDAPKSSSEQTEELV